MYVKQTIKNLRWIYKFQDKLLTYFKHKMAFFKAHIYFATCDSQFILWQNMLVYNELLY